MDDLISTIGNLFKKFQEQAKAQLPAMEMEVNQIIEQQVTEVNFIENYLDSLLGLCQHDIGNDLYIKLLEYYKTVNEENAKFYWDEYDKLDD